MVKGDANHLDMAPAGPISVTIRKAEVTVTANDQRIFVGGTVPDLTSPVLGTHYTVTGLVGNDTLTTVPTLAYSSKPDNTHTGTYTITPGDANAGSNYIISYKSGILTVTIEEPQFTITFNPGDGSGTMNPVKIKNGEQFTFPSSTFTPPSGHVFAHWKITTESMLSGNRSQ